MCNCFFYCVGFKLLGCAKYLPAFKLSCPTLCQCCYGSRAGIGDGKGQFIVRWRIKSRGNQVREELFFQFSDINLTRSPLLYGFDLRAPPSGALLAFLSRRVLGNVGFKFKTCLGLVVHLHPTMRALFLLLPFSSLGIAWIR